MDSVTLSISELFGPTLQGEGPSVGRPCIFLRLSLCNLDCSWCDTPYTWDWSGKNGIPYSKEQEIKKVPVETVEKWIRENATQERLVITGGEPLLQQTRLTPMVDNLVGNGWWVEFETNGTIMPNDDLLALARFNVSPKLSSSGVELEKAIVPSVIRRLNDHGAAFKFVVKTVDDFHEMRAVVTEFGIDPWKVYVMPEGRTRQEILRTLPEIFDLCSQNGWNLSPRLHVLCFNDEREK